MYPHMEPVHVPTGGTGFQGKPKNRGFCKRPNRSHRWNRYRSHRWNLFLFFRADDGSMKMEEKSLPREKAPVLVSDCCNAPFTTEVWVSKIIRRIRVCRLCDQPCRAIKKMKPLDRQSDSFPRTPTEGVKIQGGFESAKKQQNQASQEDGDPGSSEDSNDAGPGR